MASHPLYPASLAVHAIRLQANMGVTGQERDRRQEIVADLRFHFPALPEWALDDASRDYLCYEKIVGTLKKLCAEKSFRLLEFCCHEMYRLLRAQLPEDVKISLTLTKYPKEVQGLEGGCSFSFSDLPA